MCEQGFVKGKSNNLPRITMDAVSNFMKTVDRFHAAKVRRGAKASGACRERYGDAAISYVQIKREGEICTVKCRVGSEHKVQSKTSSTTVIINESTKEIVDTQCQNCAPATGRCKHALAVVMWIYRRSEEPAPTKISCYWTKSRLSRVGTVQKYIETKDLGVQKERLLGKDFPDNSTVSNDVKPLAESNQIDGQLSRPGVNLKCLETNILSLHILISQFYHSKQVKTARNFITFARTKMTQDLCDEAEKLTRNQSDCPQWFEFRYGRVTASKLHETAHCKKASGSLVYQIIGASKVHETAAMLRGIKLEKLVLIEIERQLNTRIYGGGLFLLPNYPVLGASPDGLTTDYIVEIKCPSTQKGLARFLTKDKINPKCQAQMQLQMLAAGKKKGLFCVADPAFERTKKVYLKWLEYDPQAVQNLIEKAMTFWDKNIFPLLLSSVED